jgi:hypothetical protein
VYGLTEAMVGTLDRIKNVGMISNNDATTTATVTMTVKVTGRRSQVRCHAARANRVRTPAGAGMGCPGAATYGFRSAAAFTSGT